MEARLVEPDALARLVTLLPAGASAAAAGGAPPPALPPGCPCGYACPRPCCAPPHPRHPAQPCLPARPPLRAADGEALQLLLAPMLRLLQGSPRLAVELAQVRAGTPGGGTCAVARWPASINAAGGLVRCSLACSHM